ncbi:MAG: hypothetical protein HQK54_07650, partial [Oligoflexales bacterium]|nr:hypothetical protein [Oligoflexales bacterium]
FISQRSNLPLEGYGALAVCNDSVAVIEDVINGKINPYPILIEPKLILEEICRRESMTDANEDIDQLFTLEFLGSSVASLPADHRHRQDAAERILNAFPWEEGKEPFQVAIEARRILKDHLNRTPAAKDAANS